MKTKFKTIARPYFGVFSLIAVLFAGFIGLGYVVNSTVDKTTTANNLMIQTIKDARINTSVCHHDKDRFIAEADANLPMTYIKDGNAYAVNYLDFEKIKELSRSNDGVAGFYKETFQAYLSIVAGPLTDQTKSTPRFEFIDYSRCSGLFPNYEPEPAIYLGGDNNGM